MTAAFDGWRILSSSVLFLFYFFVRIISEILLKKPILLETCLICVIYVKIEALLM